MNEGIKMAVKEAAWHELSAHVIRQMAQLFKILTEDIVDKECSVDISGSGMENPLLVTGCLTNLETGKQLVILWYDSANTEKKFKMSLAGANESMTYKFKSSFDDRGYTYSEMQSMLKDRKFFWSFL